MNIAFNYLYRDADNFKKYGKIIFKNPTAMTCEVITMLLKNAFIHGQFIADQINIPEIFYDIHQSSLADHCFHEFVNIEYSDLFPNDRTDRSVADFIKEVECASRNGWLIFDPWEREYHRSFIKEGN